MPKSNKKRVFISVPFGGRSYGEICEDASKAMQEYANRVNPDDPSKVLRKTDFIHNYFVSGRVAAAAANSKHPKVVYLAEAIRQMASCDEVIFAGDWEHANGCAVERLVYERYFQKENSES